MFPPLTIVLPSLAALAASGELLRHAATSLETITLGFTLATAIGFSLGVLIVQVPASRAVIMPVVDAVRPVAALTLFPLLILLLGIGTWSKVFVIFWTAWPAVLLNTAHGLDKVDADVRSAAQIDGAGRLALFRYIELPLAFPMIMTGLRIGLSGGWISLVSAEMLGSSSGLGYSILAYSQTFRFPQMYAVIITIAFIGLAMNVCLSAIQFISDWEKTYVESPFVRFGDRASAWNIAGWMHYRAGHGSG